MKNKVFAAGAIFLFLFLSPCYAQIQIPHTFGTEKPVPTSPPIPIAPIQITNPDKSDPRMMAIPSGSEEDLKKPKNDLTNGPPPTNKNEKVDNTISSSLLLENTKKLFGINFNEIPNELKADFLATVKEQLKAISAAAIYESDKFKLLSENFKSELKIRERAFDQQYNFGWWSLIITHFLLAYGIGLSIFEAKSAYKLRKNGTLQNELNINLQGLAVKTSFLSILILSLTLGFYFLYLKFVYTITQL